jgi:hypothetical protein
VEDQVVQPIAIDIFDMTPRVPAPIAVCLLRT